MLFRSPNSPVRAGEPLAPSTWCLHRDRVSSRQVDPEAIERTDVEDGTAEDEDDAESATAAR